MLQDFFLTLFLGLVPMPLITLLFPGVISDSATPTVQQLYAAYAITIKSGYIEFAPVFVDILNILVSVKISV